MPGSYHRALTTARHSVRICMRNALAQPSHVSAIRSFGACLPRCVRSA